MSALAAASALIIWDRRDYRWLTSAGMAELDTGCCPSEGCLRRVQWKASKFVPGHIILRCGHHGGGFVLVVDAGSFWHERARQYALPDDE